MKSKLFDKVYGALIGLAIGDAFNAPTELRERNTVEDREYFSEEFLPFDHINISSHGIWSKEIGSYTDDTRLSKIVLDAMVKKQARICCGDLKKEVIEYYNNAENELVKSFIEEYFYKAVYGEHKEVFGGQPTNGGIMSVIPFGVINAVDGAQGYEDAFNCLFYSCGYARTAAALAAAITANCFSEGESVKSIVEKSLQVSRKFAHDTQGKLWTSWDMYDTVNCVEPKVNEVLNLSLEKGEDALDEIVEKSKKEFFADGQESLCLAVSAFAISNGDFKKCMILCRKMLRDCDSSGAVAGGFCGAYNGASKIPQEWIDLVEKVNPDKPMHAYAEEITEIILNKFEAQEKALEKMRSLIDGEI